MNSQRLSPRYKLGDILGVGGMSEVYAATDSLLDRSVAVKVLRTDLARDSHFYERFVREARNAASLNHPAIVAVYDSGEFKTEQGPLPYIVMERVEGHTLRDIVKSNGSLNPRRAMTIMAEVCSALQYSHNASIIHRDIKPANVMITSTGAVKVMDFGIARLISDATSAMTQTSAVLGTAQYLSPEQARGQKVDARSDVYSAGCVLYEILTGRPPFVGDSPVSVAYQHVNELPELPSTLVDGISPELDAVVMKALAKDVNDRYQSATMMQADLISVLHGQHPIAPMIKNSSASLAPSRPSYDDEPTMVNNEDAIDSSAPAEEQDGQSQPQLADQESSDSHTVPLATRVGSSTSRQTALRSSDLAENTEEETDEQPRKGLWTRLRRRPGVLLIVIVMSLGLSGFGGALVYNWITGDGLLYKTGVRIPNVDGLSVAEAQAKLSQAGFTTTSEEVASPDTERGIVLRTEPSSGRNAPKGSRVIMIVSAGRGSITMPSLKGLSEKDARERLTEAGFEGPVRVQRGSSTKKENGKVIDQSIPENDPAPRDRTIIITIGAGPEDTSVPISVGLTREAAQSNIEGAGFKVKIVEVDSIKPKDEVLEVRPSDKAPKGSEVEVRVSKGNQFLMPDLRGTSRTRVYAILQEAGWKGSQADLVFEEVSTLDPSKAGLVFAQRDQPGSLDNEIRIVVSVWRFGL